MFILYASVLNNNNTKGHVLTPLPGAISTKPGSACFPFFGIDAAILDPNTGEELKDEDIGDEIDNKNVSII